MEWELLGIAIASDIFFNSLSMVVTVTFCDSFMERRASPKRFLLLFLLSALGNFLLLNLLGASMGTVGNIVIPLLTALPLIYYGILNTRERFVSAKEHSSASPAAGIFAFMPSFLRL